MPTIDSTYFYGANLIPQLTSTAVLAEVNQYIAQYEEEYFDKVFGYKFKKLYKAGITALAQIYLDIQDGKEYTDKEGNDRKWNGLKYVLGATKLSPIADYVYYWYTRQHASMSTGSGEKELDAENSTTSASAVKQMREWKDMVKKNKELSEILLSNYLIYTDFKIY